MKPEVFKQRVRVILECDVAFLGKDFNTICRILEEDQAEAIYRWLQKVVLKEVDYIVRNTNRKYKSYQIRELLVFRYPFIMQGNQYRIMLVKVKNSIYIEFHLGGHKYYDNLRKELSLS